MPETNSPPPPATAIPSSVALLGRSCVITVGSVVVTDIGAQLGLDVWFQVRRSLKPRSPNTCDIKLFNLSDKTRKAIEQSAQPQAPPGGGAPATTIPGKDGAVIDNTETPVTIVAGYVGAASLIFQGALRSAQTVTDGATTTTELTTGDGDQAAILARTTYSFPKGANAYTVAQQLLKDMACGVGNIDSATIANTLKSSGYGTNGITVKGSSYAILSDLAKSCGLEVTIQKDVAQWLPLGQPIGGQGYLLQTTPTNTGVIGSPSVDTKGVLAIDLLMMPGIAPGISVVVKTAYISGLFRVTTVETTGDMASADWHHSCECKRIGDAP